MTKYRVEVPYLIWVTSTVEAVDEEDAITVADKVSRPIALGHSLVGPAGCDLETYVQPPDEIYEEGPIMPTAMEAVSDA